MLLQKLPQPLPRVTHKFPKAFQSMPMIKVSFFSTLPILMPK